MPNRVQVRFINDALDSEHLLTEWELEFLNSLADLPPDKALSDRQNVVLNRIIQKINREGA